jgi:2-hydroxy-6-oxonona-2,4-dienedioate hydrolase
MRVAVGRNGIFGGWTHAGSQRVFVRVPTALKQRAAESNADQPAYEETPIVLVHGIGASSRSLKPAIHALGEEHPVFALDLPGFGLSDFPTHPLDVTGLAEALRRWMLENQVAPAVVVGFSSGCQVAVDLAARYPELVEKLVLYGPTMDPEGRNPIRLASRWLRGAIHSSPGLAPRLVHDWIDAGPWRAARSLKLALEDRIESKLPEIDAPTLVVRARHDHLVPQSWAERVTDSIAEAELASVRGGHGLGSRAAAELASLIERFASEPAAESSVAEAPSANGRRPHS